MKRALVIVVVVMVVIVAGGLGAPTRAQSPAPPPVLGSTAVTWEEIQAKVPPEAKTRQVFRHPTATLDELELHVTRLAPGVESHPPHRHPDEEVVIIREGTVEVFLNGVTKRVGPGSVIFQASNQLHGLRNVGDVPAVYHVIKWNSPGMLKAREAK